MTSTSIYHYVYRITNLVENKHYYGKRSSKIEPKKDLGKKYFSSSSDKNFIKDQKENPQNYKYKIVAIFTKSSDALEREKLLHFKFNVNSNIKFYNRAKQTSKFFDNTGNIHSDEAKKKIAKSRTGKQHSDETKKKIAESLKGKKHSDETKRKIGIASTNRVHKKPIVFA